MNLKWIDVQEIAIELFEKFPNIDPQYVNFPDMHRWICELDGFDDEPDRSNEKVLEAIQMAWMDEVN